MVMNANGTNAHPVHDPDANAKQYVPAWQPLNPGRS